MRRLCCWDCGWRFFSMSYLHWNEQTTTDFSDANITALYHEGYVFTRLGKGVMHQTRSLRVDLSKFELTSENRRILRKIIGLQTTDYRLPLATYDWSIGKMAKDFYDTRFGKGTMSANKVKELLTDEEKSNFNLLLAYKFLPLVGGGEEGVIGYAICYENNDLLHYAYPFYQMQNAEFKMQNLGMGMMLKAIIYAKEKDKKYIYLGSAQRTTDTYKLQFQGLEWFDGAAWQNETTALKAQLQPA